MIWLIIGLIIGIILGWMIPQPQWATDLIAKIRGKTGL